MTEWDGTTGRQIPPEGPTHDQLCHDGEPCSFTREDVPKEPDNVFELFLALAVGGLFFIAVIVGLMTWGPY